jgi:hypothetical protein
MPVGLSPGAALRTNVQIGCNIVHIPYLVNYSVIEKPLANTAAYLR